VSGTCHYRGRALLRPQLVPPTVAHLWEAGDGTRTRGHAPTSRYPDFSTVHRTYYHDWYSSI
jgi:hypothetical protein